MTPALAPDASTDGLDLDALAAWVSERLGGAPASLTPIAPGLGHRHFLRVALEGAPGSVILRVDRPGDRPETPGIAPEPPLEPIRAHLEAAGIPVPKSHGHDGERGLDLLEDVGDHTLEQAALGADANTRRALYLEAIDVALRLQAVEAPPADAPRVEAYERRLDRALVATKARKVNDWLLPEMLHRDPSQSERAIVDRAFDAIADLVEAAPARLSHRDYKAANIHLRDEGGLALIDLQGAFMAPPEYDLVCLLRDSHVPMTAAEVDALLEVALERLPVDVDAARLRFDALTISRVGKDLAHYLDAARTRGDDRYLGFVGVGLARLQTAAERLAARDPSWRALGELVASLALPSRCVDTPAPEWLA